MQKFVLTFVLTFINISFLVAQITNGQDTLYGNEWINFDQSYFKIAVVHDAMHKVTYQQLEEAGVPVDQIEGSQYQLFHNGEELPIYTTSSNIFTDGDHLEFYGEINRSQLDQHLFQDPDNEMMNPYYSLFNDTSAYFLTWTDFGTPLRFEEVENDLTNSPDKEEFYIENQIVEYHNHWRQEGYNFAFSSTFNKAEGYSFTLKNLFDYSIEPTFPYIGGTDPVLSVRYSSNSNDHIQQISLNGDIWNTDTFSLIGLRQIEKTINENLLNDPITVRIQGLIDNNDKHRVSNIILKYARQFNALDQNNFTFNLTGTNNRKYLEIVDFNNAGNESYLFDLKNKKRIITTEENNLIKISIPAFNQNSTFHLINKNGLKVPASILPVSFIDYSNESAEYIILSNKKLFDDGQGNNRVEEYAAYRQSMEGGNYSTLIVDVQQLYDQFGWGINRHAISIRNFGLFINKNWSTPAEYLFIIGKGRNYNTSRTKGQLNAANNASFYVPTFGVPGSDVLLMCNKGRITPNLAVGRLPVETPAEIAVYLNKIKEHEKLNELPSTIEDRAWMKRVLHLGGGSGSSQGEQSLIKNYLEGMGEILKNNEFGAEVHGYYKTSTDPIQVSVNEAIFKLIDDGVSIISFFGHSSTNSFDFGLDSPINYNNKGKYPMIFSMGCYIGGIHTSNKSASERFVLQPEAGAIGFIGSTGAGYISSLNNFTRTLYSLLGGDLYGKGFGEIMKEANKRLEDSGFGDRFLLQQFTFNGDPALNIKISEGPDLTVDYSTINIEPNFINLSSDNFELEFDLVNIGRANQTDSLVNYIIKQELPNNEIFELKSDSVGVPNNRSRVKVALPILNENSLGFNKLHIELDSENAIEELPLPDAESNNQLKSPIGEIGYPFYVIDNSAIPVYPNNYAIVGDSDITLKASTAETLAPLNKYIFEIDTTKLFNSIMKKSSTIEQIGGVVKWKPEIDYKDGQVYYWRISPDSIDQEIGYVWENRSFTFIDGSLGWSQRDYYQFNENRLNEIKLNEENGRFEFPSDFVSLRIRNKLFNSSDPPNGFVDGAKWSDFFRWQLHESMTVVVFDTIGKQWFNENPGQYGSVNTNAPRIGAFPFPVKETDERANLIDFLENIIPDDFWVVIYPARRTLSHTLDIDEWESDSLTLDGKNIFNVLEAQGAQKVRSLRDSLVPYCFAYRKIKNVVLEEWADTPTGETNSNIAVEGFWYEGNMRSEIIGPAKNWQLFNWEYDSEGLNDRDSFNIKIYGVEKNKNNEHLIFNEIVQNSLDISSIATDSFPYLRLEFYAFDDVELSPAQIKEWNIIYEGVPDIAINPFKGYLFYKDTIQEGEILKLETYAESINEWATDSVLIGYNIRTGSDGIYNKEIKVSDISSGQELPVSFSYNTQGLKGDHQLIVELNKDDEQLELHSFNNYLIKDFHVLNDKKNPVMDVTFDGVHILNGDIVSPEPVIQIELIDENEFLLLNDTSLFKMFLQSPDGELKNISLNSPNIIFQPSNSVENNKALLQWSPKFEIEGEYSLIIQAKDITGNSSGEFDYKIKFQVILESMISNFLAYPNPFSTSTKFVYTMTGATPPNSFKMQILTVAGRVVREVDQMEIGPLKTGTHLTDFVWDGTDQYGDQLANGIYLYHLMAVDKGGEEFKHFESDTDKYFFKGYGKVALIR